MEQEFHAGSAASAKRQRSGALQNLAVLAGPVGLVEPVREKYEPADQSA